MNIVADENIPFACELFSELGSVTLLSGREIKKSDLKTCDALLIRSVTKVNAELLDDTPVKFVGTCTIGEDHLDVKYLKNNNISYASAPGCNANSVVQYVICALLELKRLDASCRMAIVGGGNVGKRIYKMFTALGFDCIVVDPFLSKDMQENLCSFNEVFHCDIVCLHAPLTTTGPHPTYHMFGYDELKKMKPGALLLNAGRGGVIDNTALLTFLSESSQSEKNNSLHVVLDVWENEPEINKALFEYLALGTPHIAGYSFEGKTNGTIMSFCSLAKALGKSIEWIEQKTTELKLNKFGEARSIAVSSVGEAIKASYDIREDNDCLKGALSSLPKSFDLLRKNYHQRREFSHYLIDFDEKTMAKPKDASTTLHTVSDHKILKILGFLAQSYSE